MMNAVALDSIEIEFLQKLLRGGANLVAHPVSA
jgi:hypothetical protein